MVDSHLRRNPEFPLLLQVPQYPNLFGRSSPRSRRVLEPCQDVWRRGLPLFHEVMGGGANELLIRFLGDARR